MNSFFKRLSYIIDNEGISITKLETLIGASKGVLSRASRENTSISSEWLMKLVEKYPQYNANWLLTGEGSMLKEKDILVGNNGNNNTNIINSPNSNNKQYTEADLLLLQKENEHQKVIIEQLKDTIDQLKSTNDLLQKLLLKIE